MGALLAELVAWAWSQTGDTLSATLDQLPLVAFVVLGLRSELRRLSDAVEAIADAVETHEARLDRLEEGRPPPTLPPAPEPATSDYANPYR